MIPQTLADRGAINQALYFGASFETVRLPALLTPRNIKGTMFFLCSTRGGAEMLKVFVEEAAALASITLFVGMIAIWAQLIPQL
jgi:hypothetical protein